MKKEHKKVIGLALLFVVVFLIVLHFYGMKTATATFWIMLVATVAMGLLNVVMGIKDPFWQYWIIFHGFGSVIEALMKTILALMGSN